MNPDVKHFYYAKEHQGGQSTYTKGRVPFELIYYLGIPRYERCQV